MIFKKLHAIYFFVDDVKASSSWYGKVLGIPPDIDDENFGLFRIGIFELCFHKADKKSPVSTGGCVGYWQVDYLNEAIHLFVVHGGMIYRGPIEIPGEHEGICQIKDPFGNVIGLQGKFKKSEGVQPDGKSFK
jgi:predicted enzyme related to lactoylglutathione lyase